MCEINEFPFPAQDVQLLGSDWSTAMLIRSSLPFPNVVPTDVAVDMHYNAVQHNSDFAISATVTPAVL
jgi:hypothetical protein